PGPPEERGARPQRLSAQLRGLSVGTLHRPWPGVGPGVAALTLHAAARAAAPLGVAHRALLRASGAPLVPAVVFASRARRGWRRGLAVVRRRVGGLPAARALAPGAGVAAGGHRSGPRVRPDRGCGGLGDPRHAFEVV